MIKEFAR